MKTTSTIQWWAGRLAIGAVVAAFALGSVNAGEDRPPLAQLREKAQELERKSRDLKADGRHEEALRLAREVEEIRTQARRMEREGRAGERPELKAHEELQQKLEHSLAKLEELRSAGKEPEAREVQQRVRRLEGELAQLARRPEGPREFPPPPERTDVERRLQHLREAVGNLHAAGLHEAAERVAREAEFMRQPRHGGPPFEPPPFAPPRVGIERLRAEVQELRQAVSRLQEQVQALARERH
jgi:hypothetical protein